MSHALRVPDGSAGSALCRRIALLGLAALLPLAAVVSAAPQKKAMAAPTSPIEVLNIQCDEVKLPAEFQMATYEHLLDTVKQTGKFTEVYRDGDKRADSAADLLTLHTNVSGFKQGSARARQVTTVAGASSVKVHVTITNRSGQTLLDKDVEGKVHFFGENIRVTLNLAKAIAKTIKENYPSAATSAGQ